MKLATIILVALCACSPPPSLRPPVKYPDGSKVQLRLGPTAMIIYKSFGDYYAVRVLTTGLNGQQVITEHLVKEFEIERIIQ